MKLRNATSTDSPAISALVSKVAAEHIASSLTDGGLKLLLDSMNTDATRQRIEDQWPHICALDGGDLVGVVVVKPPTHLYHLFVRSDLQRTGIGAKLLTVADSWSVETAGVRLATVNSSLNVVDVYKRFEFETHGPVIDTDGVRYQPMVRRNAEQ